MSSRDRARIGLIGYGLAGSAFHAPLISSDPRLELTAIVTGNEASAAKARSLYPDTAIVAKADQLSGLGVEAVVIATPNTSHAPLALEAISHGAHVVVDKPLALSPQQARELIAAAEEAGVLLTVFQNRRWDGDFLTVRSLIDSGSLGKVARFESRFERFRPQIKEGWRERVSPAEGGGLLFDLGAHLIDQAHVLFGPVTHVYAEVDTTRAAATTDDDVFVALTHASGVRSHLFMSAIAPDLGPRFRVLGTEAGYRVFGLDVQEAALRAGDLRPGELPGPGWGEPAEQDWGVLGDAAGSRPLPTLAGDYPRFYAEFAAALLDGAAIPVDPSDALTTLLIMDAARESSDSHSVIAL